MYKLGIGKVRAVPANVSPSDNAQMTRISSPSGPLCERCIVARSAFARAKGLLGRSGLQRGEGLLLLREPSIHTFFMRFPIDVVFFDSEFVVLKVVPGLRPWRVASRRGAYGVLELPAGSVSPELVGEQIVVEPPLEETVRNVWTAVVALVLAASCLVRFAPFGAAVVSALFVVVLTVLSATDIRERRLPNRIVLPAAALVLAGREATQHSHWAEWIVAALGAFAVLLVIHLVVPKGFAMGDVKLALLLGAGLGYHVAPALVLGFFLSGLWSVGLLARHGRAALHQTFPLGPFLALGAFVELFVFG